MKLKSNYYLALASVILLGLVSPVGAVGPLTGVALGTAAPPGTLGPWSMTPFGPDASPIDSFLTALGPITFDQAVRHDAIGNGWGTWSHGYAGNVYDTGSSLDPMSLTMTMAANVQAFYFYAEPVNFANFTFTATTDSGATLTQTINGNSGASGFGFYATGSDYIASITVTGTDADGFAVGEFGFAPASTVPEGGYSLGYLVLGLLVLGAYGRYASRRKDANHPRSAACAQACEKGIPVSNLEASRRFWHSVWGFTAMLMLALGLSPASAEDALVPGAMPASQSALITPAIVTTPLAPVYTESGALTLSLDAIGTLTSTGNIRVQKPPGATVRHAFLASATTGGSGHQLVAGEVKLAGVNFVWSQSTQSSITSYNYWGEVTDIVKPLVDAAAPGIVNLTVTEGNTASIDGEILAVVFDDPNVTNQNNTVSLLFGAQNTAGDSFAISFGEPLDPANPNLVLDMSLGISFGFQEAATVNQFSIANVNGQRLTSSAGGQDDGQAQNGALITVGGIGDSDANPPPFAPPGGSTPDRTDDELYNLVPFITNGTTHITVFTQNPSTDDNIFFAAFFLKSAVAVVNQGILLSPPAATNPIGTMHTLTALVVNSTGGGVTNRQVHFAIVSGPNAGLTADGVTDAHGDATFSYTGLTPGLDEIEASFVDDSGHTVTSSPATKLWVSAAPAVGITPVANRGYYQISATSTLYSPSQLQLYVKDSASPFVAGPFPSGTVVKIKRSLATGIGPASGPASVTIFVLGDGQVYAVDPAAQYSASVTCRSL